MLVFFNVIGLAMLALSAGVAFAAVHLTGASGNIPFMLIAGPIALACDAAYRWWHPAGHWLHPNGGGSFCFVPVWVFGALWVVLGIAHLITGQDEPGTVDAVIVGLAVLLIVGVAIVRAAPASTEDASSPSPTQGPTAEWECTRCGHKNPGHVRVCRGCGLQT